MESKKIVTSSPRHHEGGDSEERHSALSLKARFESKIKDNAPVKRNFVVSSNLFFFVYKCILNPGNSLQTFGKDFV